MKIRFLMVVCLVAVLASKQTNASNLSVLADNGILFFKGTWEEVLTEKIKLQF